MLLLIEYRHCGGGRLEDRGELDFGIDDVEHQQFAITHTLLRQALGTVQGLPTDQRHPHHTWADHALVIGPAHSVFVTLTGQ